MWVRLLHGARSLERTAERIPSTRRFSFSSLLNRIQGDLADVWSAGACCLALTDRVYFRDSKSKKKLLGIYYKDEEKGKVKSLGETQVEKALIRKESGLIFIEAG